LGLRNRERTPHVHGFVRLLETGRNLCRRTASVWFGTTRDNVDKRERIRAVCRGNYSSLELRSHMAVSDMALASSNVDEALAEIECQRELIADLMRLGQPTEAAEQALKSMTHQFACLIEQEHDILAGALQTRGAG
jgi:hypothetical protein